MATYIKTGFWEKRANPKQGYKGELNLDNLIASVAPPSSIETLGTTLYSTNPAAGTNFSTSESIFLGNDAGSGATNADESNFFGDSAGLNGTNADRSNFIGRQAGSQAVNAANCNFLGYNAGCFATNAAFSNFLGSEAGFDAEQAYHSNFFGNYAGYEATTANNCNFLGEEAGMNSTGNNVNAFGFRAHKGGTLSGQTVFANITLPSYVDRAAATTAITIGNGAVAGNTYLYYNQTTFAIEGVRL
jgi:hypothetical protein